MVRPAALVVVLTGAAALAQQPRIDSIAPSQGPIAGGFVVTIKGANLGAATLKLDRTALAPLSQSDGEIRVQMPAHDNGYAVIFAGSAHAELLYVPPRLDEIAPGSITTVAGVGSYTRDFGDAKQAALFPAGLALAGDGTLYIAEPGNNKVTRVKPDGTIERVAGGVQWCCNAPNGDGGPGAEAPVAFPLAVAVDPDGNVYIPDHNDRIRRVDAHTGIITTIAGTGIRAYSGDGGPASQAQVSLPTHIAADASDVFFSDFGAKRIRRIHLADGTISAFAGNGTAGFSGDGGPATAAQYDMSDSDNGHLALDPAGNLYIADTANFRIRRVDRKSGIITTFYALPTANAKDYVGNIRALAFDRAGNLYFSGSGRIVKVDADGHYVTTFGGDGAYALPVEGALASTQSLGHNTGLAVDAAGNILFSDDAIGRVRRINAATGRLETVAGIGPAIIGENGPAIATTFNAGASDLAFDRAGNLLIAETLRLRKIDRSGNISTIGGTGSFIGVFPPAPMNQVVMAPAGIGLDADGRIEMADLSTVDHVDADGKLRYIAGRSGICGYAGDGGPATQATLCQAWDMVRDRDQNLFIADSNNNRIRRVDARTGIITTFAGNGQPPNGYEQYGQGRTCGDGGPAIDACVNTPMSIAADPDGNLYVSEPSELRVIGRDGIIRQFAPIVNTQKMFFDRGFLYTAQIAGLMRIDAHGTVTRLAGSGTGSGTDSGFSGDGGPALSARIVAGASAMDADGNLFFADGSLRIRAVRYGAVLAPAGAGITATASGTTITTTVRDAGGRPAPSVRVDFTAPLAGATCVLSSAFAITGVDGVATVSCTPNCIAGGYSVTARPMAASSSAAVSLANSGACRPRAVRHN